MTSSHQSDLSSSEVNNLLETQWIFVLQTFKSAYGGFSSVSADIWCLLAKPTTNILIVSWLNLWGENSENKMQIGSVRCRSHFPLYLWSHLSQLWGSLLKRANCLVDWQLCKQKAQVIARKHIYPPKGAVSLLVTHHIRHNGAELLLTLEKAFLLRKQP